MKICLSTKQWIAPDLTMNQALDSVLEPGYYEGGELEFLQASVRRLKWILRTILTPEQILTLIKETGRPDAILCDLDGAE
jgi:hypothetical protein